MLEFVPVVAAVLSIGAAVAIAVRSGSLTALRAFQGKTRRSVQVLLQSFAGIAGFVCLWIAMALLQPTGYTRVPLPSAVGIELWRSLVGWELQYAVAVSFGRIAVGFGAAAVLGTAIGLLCGTYTIAASIALPTNSFFRYVPPTVFVTLLIVYLGIGEVYKYSVVFIGVFFFVVQMTVDAVRQVDRAFLEMATVVGVPRSRMLDRVVLPAVGPDLVDVIRINLSGAWTFLVAAEVVGADGGLGHMIALGQRFGRIESIFVGIVSFGVIGMVSDVLLQILRRRLFRWNTLSAAP